MICQKSKYNLWIVIAAIIIIAALVFMIMTPRKSEDFDMSDAYPCRGKPFCRQRKNCPYDGSPCPYSGARQFPCLGRAECRRRENCPFNN